LIQTKGQEKHLKKRLGITTFRPFFDEIVSKTAYQQYIFYSPKDSRWELLGTYSCFSEFTRTSSVISEVSNRSKWGGLGWLSKVDLLLF
jgi:hypothetical protein